MKRILLALLFTVASLPAYAQQWDQVNGSMQVKSGPTGPLVIIDQTAAGQKIISLRANGVEVCSVTSTAFTCTGTYSFAPLIIGTDLVQQRNSTTAQRFDVANTYTSASNNELFSVDWQTTANTALVGTRTAATGTNRSLILAAQQSTATDVYTAIKLTRASLPLIQSGVMNAAGTFSQNDSSAGTYFNFGLTTNTGTSGQVNIFAITPTYNQASGTAANTDLLINRTQTLVGSGTQLLIDAQVSNTSKFSVDNTGKVAAGGLVSAGTSGVPVNVAVGRFAAQNAAKASVAAFTVGAADASFEVSANVLVTTATTHSFTVTVAYTDEGNTSRTTTLNFATVAGVISNAAITNVGGAVPYEGVPYHIRCKAATTITIATTGTFTTVVYNVEGIIKQIS